MKRLFLIVVFAFLSKSAFSQERTFPYFETYVVPKDSTVIFYTDFKISYDKLFFEKTENGYKSELSAAVEIFGNDSLVYRKIEKKSVFVNSFDETKNPEKFVHRFFTAELGHGTYHAKFYFDIANASSSSLKFEKEIDVEKSERRILKPIVAKKIRENLYSTVSLKTVLPFSNSAYDLIIPTVLQDSVCEITITQYGETAETASVKRIFNGAPAFALIGNKFILTPKTCAKNYKMFIFENFSKKLLPGKAEIIVKIGKDTFSYPVTVAWNEMPLALNLDFVAANAMAVMFDDEKIERFEKAGKDERIKVLFDMWKSYDPDTTNAYNEILSEFFSRVDYAIKNFSSPKKYDGYRTDRGVIFIRYGKPLSMKKDYTAYDYNREIWDYGGFKFIFVDEKGNGDYKLVKKQ